MKARSSSALLKQDFFKKWMKGLQIYSSLNKDMTFVERRRAIKFSADVAIASTRGTAVRWGHALVASAAVDGCAASITVAEEILGREVAAEKKTAAAAATIACSKNIVRRSCHRLLRRRKMAVAATGVVPSAAIAKTLVRNRMRVLKMLVPGGEKLDDEISLIKETLDYITSLQVQVDVMRHLANRFS